MKALVSAFNKEKALSILRDCEIFADHSFQLYYLCIYVSMYLCIYVCALVVTEFVNPGGVLGRGRLAWHKIGYRSGAAVLGHWDTARSAATHKHKKYTTHYTHTQNTHITPYFSTKLQ